MNLADRAAKAGFRGALYDFRKAKHARIEFFNPALVRRDDGLWLVTRKSEYRPDFKFGSNELMAFSLDKDHLPQIGHPVTIERISESEHFEDPRAFFHRGGWWLSVCNFVIFPSDKTWTGAHQLLAEMDSRNWRTYRRHDPVYGKNTSNLFNQAGDEKNWLWFSHENQLYLIYQTLPHTVVRWDDNLNAREEMITSLWHPAWDQGHPRGGSAPILVGDQYVSFFHSSIPWQHGQRQYRMGAYTFSAVPPFRVSSVTPEPLLAGSQDDPWGPGKPLVVFPCGAVHENGEWTVSLGINDLTSARIIISDSVLAGKLSKNLVEIELPRIAISPLQTIYA